MEQIPFGPEVASVLEKKVREVVLAGSELASFADREPFLASDCGVEISALEVRTILGSGIPDRVVATAFEAARLGRGFSISRYDLDGISRLENVISTASSRIAQKYMALEAAGSNTSKLGSAISVVSGIAGLIKTFF